MTDGSPSISVIIPAYNAAAFIAEAITSIINQTFEDFEALIINDGSTDNTSAVAHSFSDRRVIVHDSQINKGLPTTLNIGLSLAQGTYIARLDADDIAVPERLQVQFQFMEDNPDVTICGSDMELFGKKPA